MDNIIAGTRKWFQRVVMERKNWVKQEKKNIAFAQSQITFWQKMLAEHENALALRVEWLAEARDDLAKFNAEHQKQ